MLPQRTKGTSEARARYHQVLDSNKELRTVRLNQNVVVHNMMTTTPPEDWILYPDDVVVEKHSSTRQRREARDLRSQKCTRNDIRLAKALGPIMPPTPPENSPTQNERKQAVQSTYRETSGYSAMTDKAFTLAPVGNPSQGSRKGQVQTPYPQRLPTPDLSDVEEDGLWGCCKGYDRQL